MTHKITTLLLFFTFCSVVNAQQINSPSVLADGHSYVDLGLSVKWATTNVGAQSPAGNGNYYAWGEIDTKEAYTSERSETFGQNIVDISANPDYDIATAEWGGLWRMPTKQEFDELIKKCKFDVQTINGVKVNVITGPNGNQIILPLPGQKWGTDNEDLTEVTGNGRYGYYWTSTPYEIYPSNPIYQQAYMARTWDHWELMQTDTDPLNKYIGLPIRPVYGSHEIAQQPENKKANEWVNAPSGVINGYEYVDLGLSVVWANCNVGATKPNQHGDYFAWGETQPKSDYSPNNSQTSGLKIWNISGNPLYDAATANWGAPWRMPTKEEIDEMESKCTIGLAYVNGEVCCKIIGPNGKSIVIPFARTMDGTEQSGDGFTIWAASMSLLSDDEGYIAYTQHGNRYDMGDGIRYWDRYRGFSIRPVANKNF